MAILLIATCIPFAAGAATGSGKCGPKTTWSLNSSGVLTISGTGATDDWNLENPAPWYNLRSSIKKVVIKDGVGRLGDYAFYNCSNVTSVTLPKNDPEYDNRFYTLGYYSLSGTSITSLLLPQYISSFEPNCVYNCKKLTSIKTSGSYYRVLSHDSNGILYNYDKTELICYPAGKQDTSFKTPQSVTAIRSNAFTGNDYLTDVTVSGFVNSIGKEVFSECKNLKSATIWDVTSLPQGIFKNCTSLVTLNLPSQIRKLRTVGIQAFYGCTSLKNIAFPVEISQIKAQAFEGCTSLQNVVFPQNNSGSLYIEESAFSGCKSLKSITLPNSTRNIEEKAFYNCTTLAAIKLGDSIQKIGADAFTNTAYYNNARNWQNNVLYIDKYLIASKSNISGKYEVKDGTYLIADYAFDSRSGLQEVVVPNSVSYIGVNAFGNCANLKKVYLPDYFNSISSSAFLNDNLATIYILKPSGALEYAKTNNIPYVCYGFKNNNLDTTLLCDGFDPDSINFSASELYLSEENVSVPEGRIIKGYEFGLNSISGQPVALNQTATLKIPAPSGAVGEYCKVYRKNAAGNLVEAEVRAEDGYLMIDTELLGKFFIASSVIRLAGGSRVDTSVAITSEGWSYKTDTVILANAYNFADALAGGPLSYALDAPIILTANGSTLEQDVLNHIRDLGATKVIILGGTFAVGESIENQLSNLYDVQRIYGQTRFETAVAIAEKLAEVTGEYSDSAFFAYGYNFPDALAVSAAASISGTPILFARADGSIDDATAAYISDNGVANTTILGGTGAISEAAEENLANLGATNVDRIFGVSRYDTAFAVVQRYADLFTGDDLILATGQSFPDALAGGAFGAKIKAPVILVHPKTIADGVLDYISNRNAETVYVLGGVGAVADQTVVTYLG